MTERLKQLHDKKIVFPDVTDFAELFDDVKQHNGESRTLLTLPSWEQGTWSDKGKKKTCKVSGYLAIRGLEGHRSFDVNARPAVLDYVKSSMLHGSYDTIHFEIIEWDNGECLVTAQYSQIIGSHYLAIIRADTVPLDL